MTSCWSCGKARPAEAALCPACGKVQPPPPSGTRPDRFAYFGLTPGFDVDERALEEQFRALSRKLHPDRFAIAGAQERRYSLEQTTLLNDAYKTLRDPVRRAEHFLQLRGISSEPKMSPDFLERTLEDRERLLEAKMSGEPLDSFVKAAEAKRDAALSEARKLVEEGDLQAAAERLARMKYYARYLDEAQGRAQEI